MPYRTGTEMVTLGLAERERLGSEAHQIDILTEEEPTRYWSGSWNSGMLKPMPAFTAFWRAVPPVMPDQLGLVLVVTVPVKGPELFELEVKV